MNELDGIIQKIVTEENISLVIAEAAGFHWHALVIDNPATATYLKEGGKVKLVFKESAVSLAKNASGLFSIRNRVRCRVSDIEEGNILSAVTLRSNAFTLISITTANAIKELGLSPGDDVEALIKTTDISLMEP